MKIIIRADATPKIGTGHVVRCRTLALALRERGAEVTLLAAEPVEMAQRLFEEVSLPVMTLDDNPDSAERQISPELDQDRDAQATLSFLSKVGRPDWLIVDHYQLDARWERQLRCHSNRMLIIDDLFDRPHIADALLNQNVLDEDETRGGYSGLLNDDCRVFSGPQYALLRPEYRRVPKPVRETLQRVLIFFGGVDPANLTGQSLRALSCEHLRFLHCDVVAGIGNRNLQSIHKQARARGRTTVHTGLPHLADLMAVADLVIGAGGATTWERLCCGLPAIAVSIADNQTAIAEAVAEAGAQIYAGEISDLTVEIIGQSVNDLLSDRNRLIQLSTAGPVLVDGYGTERLAEFMMPTPADQLTLRKAQPDDISVLFAWVNDPVRRSQSLDSTPIPWPTHRAWFAALMENPRCHLFILEARGLPVGQIRFDPLGDNRLRLTYALDPVVRGRRWATRLLKMGIEAVSQQGNREIVAEVRPSNTPSLRAFEQAGFTGENTTDENIRQYSLRTHDTFIARHPMNSASEASGGLPI